MDTDRKNDAVKRRSVTIKLFNELHRFYRRCNLRKLIPTLLTSEKDF